MNKRIIVCLLSLLLVIGFVSPCVSAAGSGGQAVASGVCGEDVTWVLTGEGVLRIIGQGSMWDYSYADQPWSAHKDSITSVVVERGVTAVGSNAFRNCFNLVSVSLPDDLSRIGTYAFGGCEGLREINLPGTLKKIETGTFIACTSLREILIPRGVTEIGGSAFEDSGLEVLALPEGFRKVGDYAFEFCDRLVQVTIPSSVTDIGFEAFYGCDALTEVYYKGDPAGWAAIRIGDDNFALTDARIRFDRVASPAISRLDDMGDGVRITWDQVEGAHMYRVFVQRADGGWKTLGNTAGTSFLWTGAEIGETYTFTVRCLSVDGKRYISDYNAEGWAHTFQRMPGISGLESTASGVKITWAEVTEAENYRVFVRRADGSWKTLGNTTGTSFLWAGAQTGKTYTFTVRCLSADGKRYTSGYNADGWTYRYYPAPEITGLERDSGGITLTWGSVNGAVKYRVFAQKANGGWKTLGETADTSFTWTGAKAGRTYVFTVRCLSADSKHYTSGYYAAGWSYLCE